MTPSKPLFAAIKNRITIETTAGRSRCILKVCAVTLHTDGNFTKSEARDVRHKLAYALAKIIESSK